MLKKKKFITFDGIDGAGKTTQIERLAERLREAGKTVFVTREPGGTELSEKIRDMLLSRKNNMSLNTELLLMFASRAEHVDKVLRPKILAGEWVICSRFTDATLAYQGYARGGNLEKIQKIADIVHGDINPRLSIFLDLPVEDAVQRRIKRGEVVDRFEAEDIVFMKAVRNGYLSIAKKDPSRCKVIDVTQNITLVSDTIWQQVGQL